MRFKATTTFLDGTDRFEINDERTVADERGAYFISNGWGIDVDGRVAVGAASAGDTTLDIHNAVMGQEATNG